MTRNRTTSRRGATTVELALTLPILFLLLFSAYELSRANMIMHTCEAAAYEGARVGIVPGATVAEVEAAVANVLATVGVKNANISTTPSSLATETDTVSVSVEVSFGDNSALAPVYMSVAPFTRTCVMNREVL